MIRVGGRAATWAGLSLVIGRIAMAAEGAQGPVPPEKAAATIRVPAGLHVELVASEPMVVDPVAMTIDENGVIFVAEMRDYPDAPAIGASRCCGNRAAATRSHQRHQKTLNREAATLRTVGRADGGRRPRNSRTPSANETADAVPGTSSAARARSSATSAALWSA